MRFTSFTGTRIVSSDFCGVSRAGLSLERGLLGGFNSSALAGALVSVASAGTAGLMSLGLPWLAGGVVALGAAAGVGCGGCCCCSSTAEGAAGSGFESCAAALSVSMPTPAITLERKTFPEYMDALIITAFVQPPRHENFSWRFAPTRENASVPPAMGKKMTVACRRWDAQIPPTRHEENFGRAGAQQPCCADRQPTVTAGERHIRCRPPPDVRAKPGAPGSDACVPSRSSLPAGQISPKAYPASPASENAW